MTIAVRWKKFRARMKAESRMGSAAIEFAFIAPLFFTLLLGTFEAAVIFFSQAVLQNGVVEMARLVRTGQAQTGLDQAAFRSQLCDKIAPVVPCSGNLQVDVEAYTSFGGVPNQSQVLNSDQSLNGNLNKYVTGGACDVVLVRAFYVWPVVTPVLSWFLINVQIPSTDAQGKTSYSGGHLVTATAAFRNEPFGAGGC